MIFSPDMRGWGLSWQIHEVFLVILDSRICIKVLGALLNVHYICIHTRLRTLIWDICAHTKWISRSIYHEWISISVLFSRVRTLASCQLWCTSSHPAYVFVGLDIFAWKELSSKVICFSRHVSHEPRSEMGGRLDDDTPAPKNDAVANSLKD